MNNPIQSINIELSLADAKLENYFYDNSQNKLNIRIKTWDAKLIEFVFFDVIGFVDRGGNFIMDLCKNFSENDFYKSITWKNFEGNQQNNSYSLFQFLDVGNEPYLEIICKNFDWKIL